MVLYGEALIGRRTFKYMKTFNQFINEYFKDKERRLYGNSKIYEIEIDYDYTHSGNLFGCFINVIKKKWWKFNACL
jgi:hypothetical protein